MKTNNESNTSPNEDSGTTIPFTTMRMARGDKNYELSMTGVNLGGSANLNAEIRNGNSSTVQILSGEVSVLNPDTGIYGSAVSVQGLPLQISGGSLRQIEQTQMEKGQFPEGETVTGTTYTLKFDLNIILAEESHGAVVTIIVQYNESSFPMAA